MANTGNTKSTLLRATALGGAASAVMLAVAPAQAATGLIGITGATDRPNTGQCRISFDVTQLTGTVADSGTTDYLSYTLERQSGGVERRFNRGVTVGTSFNDTGHGLDNMQARAVKEGGRVEFASSEAGEGGVVRILLPIELKE